MSEADVFAKLSRLLQTHQLNLDGDDATASDIEDIISRIDGGGSSSSSRGRGGGGASLASGRNSTQQRGGLSSRGGPGSPSGRGGSMYVKHRADSSFYRKTNMSLKAVPGCMLGPRGSRGDPRRTMCGRRSEQTNSASRARRLVH